MNYYIAILITFLSLPHALIVAMEDDKKLFRQKVETAVSLFNLERNEEQEEQLNQLLVTIFQEQDIEPEEQKWTEEQLSPFLATQKDLEKMKDNLKKQIEVQAAQFKMEIKKLKNRTGQQNFEFEWDFSQIPPSFMEDLKKANDESNKEFMEKLHQSTAPQKAVRLNTYNETSPFVTKQQLEKKQAKAQAQVYETLQKLEQIKHSINDEMKKHALDLKNNIEKAQEENLPK